MDQTPETSHENTLLPCDLSRVPHGKTPQRWVQGPLVGAGSFGTVHKCLCLDTGSLVAVKSSSAALDSTQMLALQREIVLLKQLMSPHVIRFLGESWTQEDSMPTRNLVMECAAGGSISALLKTFGRGVGLLESVVRRYTKDLLLGLRDIHAMGVAHLDIKGGNSLLTESGVKICDFGAARRVSQHEAGPVEMRGTLCWMAPEIVRGSWGGTEADIWSLGCTVIEMATGSPPWAKECGEHDWRAVMAKVGCTKDVPGFPVSLSEAGKDFLSKCLVRDKHQRWTAEKLLQHPFLTEVTGKPYTPTPLGTSPVSVLSPLRSCNHSAGSCSTEPALECLQEAVFPSFSQRADESPRDSREGPGNSVDDGGELRFLLFSACSGMPSPLLLSPLQQVAAALGSPEAETMEGFMSWIYQQNGGRGLLHPCKEALQQELEDSDLSLSATSVPIAVPAACSDGLEISKSLAQNLNSWHVGLDGEPLSQRRPSARTTWNMCISFNM